MPMLDTPPTTAPMADTEILAKGYTLVNDTQYNAGLFLLNKLNLFPGAHVLDVGCGPGNLTAYIAEEVGPKGKVVGIDPSAERIAIAHKLSLSKSGGGAAELTFFEGKAEDLSRFASDDFDFVYVNSTFHWVQDQATAMKEFARVLKAGGRLGISGGSGDFVAIHEKIKEEVLSRPQYKDHVLETGGPKFLTKFEIEALLDDAGFDATGREIVVNTIVKKAKDGYAMIEWLDTSSSGKTYGGIPLDLRPNAREEMKREWDKVTGEDGIHMNMELLVTVASKSR